jgi:hypothetical protein
MTGASIDHMVSVVVLLAAVLLFIGLFSQTLSAGVEYQSNTSTAKKCSDLLDAILLAPGIPTSGTPMVFGLENSELSQYQLNPFSLMRIKSTSTPLTSYQKINQNYSTIPANTGSYLMYPDHDAINYSTALTLLGLTGSYGFQLSLNPVVNISIVEISTSPLSLSLSVTGTGFPLTNAKINYLLIPVSHNTDIPSFYNVPNQRGSTQTNNVGSASITFSNFYLNQDTTYAFVAFAYLDGISGIGYYQHSQIGDQKVVPLLGPLSSRTVTLAHSADIPVDSSSSDILYYNTTFVLESQNYAVQETPLVSSDSFGSVISGSGNLPPSISMASYTPGILVIAYNGDSSNGVVMMPWGFSSLGFPLQFGGTPLNHGWVSTDFRQVQINGVSYFAKLSLWSTQGHQEVG